MRFTRPRMLLTMGLAASAAVPVSAVLLTGGAHAAPAFHYGIFDRAATASDGGPANASLIGPSRVIPTSVLGATEWVREGNGQICVTGDVPNTATPNETAPGYACSGGGGLASTGGVETLAAEVPTKAAGMQYSVLGIAPDGVSAVTFQNADGSTTLAPVVNNGFQLSSAKPISTVSLTLNGQTYTIPMGGK